MESLQNNGTGRDIDDGGSTDASAQETDRQTVEESNDSRRGSSRLWEKPMQVAEKRPFRQESEWSAGSAGASADEEATAAKVSTGKRGGGRCPTTGKFLKRNREEMQLEVEGNVAKKMAHIRKETARLSRSALEKGDEPAVDLNQLALDSVDVVFDVATKSKNIKGTLMKDLKDAAVAFKEVLGALQQRNISEETLKLQAENARLQAELTELRKDLADLRADLGRISSRSDMEELPPVAVASLPRTTPSHGADCAQLEEMTRAIMLQVGNMINARFEGVADRLLPEKRLRPPLAVDRSRETREGQETSIAQEAVKLVEEPRKGRKSLKRGKKSVTQVAHALTPREPRELHPAPVEMNEGWVKVVKRGKPTKQVALTAPQAARKAVSLQSPRSAAVVVTLLPEAVERGVTYGQVLAEAKAKIDLVGLGITALRFRQAVTGARILEVPGVMSGEKADSLAEKIKEAINNEDIKVSRPTKSVEVRISGLDDSVTKEEVVAAVVRDGNCPVGSVKAGEIRQEPSGTGAVWVRCPVAAAKKLADSGRLLVGWVAAQVRLLKPRPMRCYRCLEAGHVSARCTSEIDRSAECYRCGKPGHKARQCTAAAHCSVCYAAKKPAEHRLGSAGCDAPSSKGKGKKSVATMSQQPIHPSATSEAREQSEYMDIIT